jgi:hypothetical protein
VLSPGVKTSGIAVDSSHIFFTESEASGSVWRANKSVGAIAQVLIAGQVQPYGIAVGPAYVYWGSSKDGNGEVRRANKNKLNGNHESLENGQFAIRNVVVEADLLVYWTSASLTDGFVVRYDTLKSQTDPLLSRPGAAEYCAVDATHIYWAASDGTLGQILRLPKDYVPNAQPPPVETIFEQNGAHPLGVAVDDEAVYFTDDAVAGKGRVLKVAK